MEIIFKRLIIIIPVFIIIYGKSQEMPFRFNHITTKQGLTTTAFYTIYKDSQGFMWFVGLGGLNRFDGYQIKTFSQIIHQDDTISLGFCSGIYEDEQNNLFIGTHGYGLAKFSRSTETFTNYIHNPKDKNSISRSDIRTLYKDREGGLWIGTIYGGLNKYNQVNETFNCYYPDTINQFSECNCIYSLYEDSKGVFWVGTRNGIFQFDKEDFIFRKINPEPIIPEYYNTIGCILEDSDGYLYFGTVLGIYKFDRKSGNWSYILSEHPKRSNTKEENTIISLAEYSNENQHQILIGTQGGGLKIYDCKTELISHHYFSFQEPKGILSNRAGPFFIDENKLLWMGGGGINVAQLQRNPFKHIILKSLPDSICQITATCFFQDKDGYIWIGTYDNGIFKLNSDMQVISNSKPTVFHKFKPTPIYKNHILNIYEDSERNLWISSQNFGVDLFDRNTNSFISIPFDTITGNPTSFDVYKITEDSYGVKWFATESGLYYRDPGLKRLDEIRLFNDTALNTAGILDIFEDSKRCFWIITQNRGVFCLLPENRNTRKLLSFPEENYLKTKNSRTIIRSAYEDNEGTLWLRSESELYVFDRGKNSIDSFKSFDDSFKGYVFKFTGDHKGNLWCVTDQGLIRFDPKDSTARNIKKFTTDDGLPFDDMNHFPFFTDKRGYIYCGSSSASGNGFFRFHPDSIPPDNLHIPPIAITEFKVRNENIKPDTSISQIKHILLKYNQNFFSFEFAALDYVNPLKNQYAYKLEGLDEEWIYSGNRRFANYTGIPSGDYVFRVKGSNNDGYWNETGTSVRLTILSPPWKRWWSYTLYGLLVCGVIYTIVRYYLKRKELIYKLTIEHIQTEKLEEIDKLKSRFFANISHEFRTPLTLILGPLEKLKSKTKDLDCKKDLNVMQRNARRLQELINQLLNLSKLEAGQMKLHASDENIIDLLKGYVNSFESLAKQKQIELKFSAAEDSIYLYVDWDKIEKILYNLLSNAFKFTEEGGLIEVAVCCSQSSAIKMPDFGSSNADWRLQTADFAGQWVEIKVSDTGKGIPTNKLAYVFDRFYQVDDSYTKDYEGTGIGLALARELVDLHHGNITVESQVGKGTVFTVFLPKGKEHLRPDEIVETNEPLKSANLKYYTEPFTQPFKRVKIDEPELDNIQEKEDVKPLLLVIEDNDDLRNYMHSFLESDYNLTEAIDGEHGLNKAIDKIPDLVITDVMMPKMDGYQLCKKLKTDERTSHIPVIMLTAKASLDDRIEGLETGADDFLTKPFDPQELKVRINNLILQRKKLREHYAKEFNLQRITDSENLISIDERFLQKAKRIAEEKMSDPDFTIEAFAGLMAMSRVQLHRKIKALLNLSSSEFIRNLRLNRAAILLKAKKGNVTEVAFEVGFNNLSWFSKCFHEQFGVLPSEYINHSS